MPIQAAFVKFRWRDALDVLPKNLYFLKNNALETGDVRQISVSTGHSGHAQRN